MTEEKALSLTMITCSRPVSNLKTGPDPRAAFASSPQRMPSNGVRGGILRFPAV